jgi:hypothetical protein
MLGAALARGSKMVDRVVVTGVRQYESPSFGRAPALDAALKSSDLPGRKHTRLLKLKALQ